MAIQYINTGSSANAGNGDSLRSAFVKVNNNFAYLSTSSGSAGNGYTGSQGDIGYAGSQGNIGYTGSAGISNVNIEISPESEVNSLAFYQTTSTISRVPRIKTDGGVLFIGDKNSPGFLSGLYIENSLSAEGFGRGFTYANHLEVAEANNFTFYRSRGTPLVPTATVSGDEIVDINFLGHNGTTATYGFNITASIDQVPVGGQQPMRLTFAGNNNAGQILPHLIITSTGTIRMNKLGAIGNSTSISILSSLIPSVNAGYDLGSTSSQWRSLYVSSSTIYIDRKALSIDANNNITINGEIATGGYTGSRGSLGYTGSRGNTGYDGSQGDIGYAGSRGDLGYTGSRGDTGYDGSQGDIGYTGSEGTPGQQGNRGYTGSEGAQGTPGLQGLTGAQGVSIVLVGSTDTVTTSTVGLGNAGQGWINTTDGDVYFWNTLTTNWENIGPIVGPQGDLGYTGSQGSQGDIGLAGDLGYTGSQGDRGYDGSRGDVGYAGSQGELGYVGSQGDIGYVGSQGDIGYSGSQGELGYVGSQGDVGYTGSRGSTGFTGSNGDLGYTGSKGDPGTAGIDTTSTLVNGNFVVGLQVNGSLLLPTGDYQENQSRYQGAIISENESSVIYMDVQTNSQDDVYGGMRLETWNSVPIDIRTRAGGQGDAIKNWRFDSNGSITFPDDTVQTTAYTGQTGSNTVVTVSDTAPTATTGTQWFNTVEGRTYIAYNGVWVDASPLMMPAPDTDIDVVSITFPDASVQTTAFTGDSGSGWQLTSSTSVVSLDSNGVLTLPNGASIGSDNSSSGIPMTTDRGTILFGNVPEVGPTASSHFHIMKDSPSTVDLFFGDDYNYVKLPSNNGVQIGTGGNIWEFGTTGTLTLPNSGIISDGMGAIRLEPSGASSSTQALLIYPTVQDGNHIHLTAGGGETDLYLGSDIQYVKVDHSGSIVVGTVGANTSTWTFGIDGTLTLPLDSSIQTIGDESFARLRWLPTGGDGSSTETAVIVASNGVSILTDDPNNENTWLFGTDGLLTLPSGNIRIGNAFGADAIMANTGTNFGIVSQGSGSSILQWIDDISDSTAIAGIAVNSMYSSTGSVQIYTGAVGLTPQHAWTFGADGSTTLPIGVSIDESNGSQFPRIVADSGKAFSLQGQGSTGSAAISWLDYESTSSQYAAVGVSKGGGEGLANVVLTAGASTPTLKVWRFDETGTLTFPDSTVQTTAWTGTVAYSNVTGAPTTSTYASTYTGWFKAAGTVVQLDTLLARINSTGTMQISTTIIETPGQGSAFAWNGIRNRLTTMSSFGQGGTNWVNPGDWLDISATPLNNDFEVATVNIFKLGGTGSLYRITYVGATNGDKWSVSIERVGLGTA